MARGAPRRSPPVFPPGDAALRDLLRRVRAGDRHALEEVASSPLEEQIRAVRRRIGGRLPADADGDIRQTILAGVLEEAKAPDPREPDPVAAAEKRVRRNLRLYPVRPRRGGRPPGGRRRSLSRTPPPSLSWSLTALTAALRAQHPAAREAHERYAVVEAVAERAADPRARIYAKEVGVPLLPRKPSRSPEPEVLRLMWLDITHVEAWQADWARLARDADRTEIDTDRRLRLREALASLIFRLGAEIPRKHRIVLRETAGTPNPLPCGTLARVLRMPVGEVERVARLGFAYSRGAFEGQLEFAFMAP